MKPKIILKGSKDDPFDELDKFKRESPEGYAELDEASAEFGMSVDEFFEQAMLDCVAERRNSRESQR
jgi:hypothetical protein